MKLTMALLGVAAVATAFRVARHYYHLHMPSLFLFVPVLKIFLLAGATVRLILAMPDEPEKYGQAYMTFAAVLR